MRDWFCLYRQECCQLGAAVLLLGSVLALPVNPKVDELLPAFLAGLALGLWMWVLRSMMDQAEMESRELEKLREEMAHRPRDIWGQMVQVSEKEVRRVS